MSFFKKLIRTLGALALVFTLTLSLASCMGRTVVGAYLNSENELIIKYSDGTRENLGCVKGDPGDPGIKGEQGDMGYTGKTGKPGKDGVSITKTEINSDGDLVIYYSDGTSESAGKVAGDGTISTLTALYREYKTKYGYDGNENEWLIDAISGNICLHSSYDEMHLCEYCFAHDPDIRPVNIWLFVNDIDLDYIEIGEAGVTTLEDFLTYMEVDPYSDVYTIYLNYSLVTNYSVKLPESCVLEIYVGDDIGGGDYGEECYYCEDNDYDGFCDVCGTCLDHLLYVEKVTIVQPTYVSEGYEAYRCLLCGEIDFESAYTVPGTTPNVTTLTSTSPSYVVHSTPIWKVQGDKHFYPTYDDPDGNDLLIEVSLFYSELFTLTKGCTINIGRISLDNTNDGNGLFYLSTTNGINGNDCQFAGGFETGSRIDQLFGPEMPVGGTAEKYPYIGEYGWHRIGVRVHQDVEVVGGVAVYSATATLYVDGERIAEHSLDLKETNLLYYAVVEDGEIVDYIDNDMNSRYIYAYRLDDFKTKNEGDIAYFYTADVYVSCGNDFVLNVAPADEPTFYEEVNYYDIIEGSGYVYFDILN